MREFLVHTKLNHPACSSICLLVRPMSGPVVRWRKQTNGLSPSLPLSRSPSPSPIAV